VACRTLGIVIIAVSLSPNLARAAADTPYPNRPLRLVVPFPAGGPVELLGRAFTQRLAESMGQPFVFDNRPGASGTIGTEFVAKASRDGYTLLITNCSHSSNAAYYRKLPYDSWRLCPDYPDGRDIRNLLVVHSVGADTFGQEFIARQARPRPAQLCLGRRRQPQHVTGALFASMAGIKLTHVAYKGNAPALNDLVGGHVEVYFVSPSFGLPYVEQRRLRALGIAGPRRLPTQPDLPTFHEAGLTGYDYTCYHGMWYPAGVPAEIVRRMHAEIGRRSLRRRCENTSRRPTTLPSATRRRSSPRSSGTTFPAGEHRKVDRIQPQ
jgi:tripartite-type tricarboxylate transporter receptor subunit TctC